LTSHELAHLLLNDLDLPVQIEVGTPHDTIVGDLGDVSIIIETIDVEGAMARGFHDTKPGKCVVLRSWMSSEDDEEYDE